MKMDREIIVLADKEVEPLLSRQVARDTAWADWPSRDANITRRPEIREILHEINREIRNESGYCVLRITPETVADPHLITVAYWNLFTCLGDPITQYSTGELLFGVRTTQSSAPLMSHYSQSNRGGGFHTDGTFLRQTPFFVGLICLEQAQHGGDSILIDGRMVCRELAANHPEVLQSLQREYYFDCCGQLPGIEARLKPIISAGGGEIFIQYLRSYIVEGHAKVGQPLGAKAIAEIDIFDSLLEREDFQLLYKLRPGEMLIFNNRFMLHGRKPFYDEGDGPSRRHLIRVYAEGQCAKVTS
jgi:TfdA family taurine catabolism dioxygenase TauD